MEKPRSWSKVAGILLAALSLPLSAAKPYCPKWMDGDFHIANNHLWRGIEVSDGLVMTSSLSVHDPGNHIRFGLWGGTNTSGDYKEFNQFLELRWKRFKLAFWDTYNFSPGATYNNREFFNYSAATTGRFLDAIMTYHCGASFPLQLQASTILFGRDRDAENRKNRYSSYVYAEYPLLARQDWHIAVGCGGTFTLRASDDRTTFYSDRPGVIHVELRVCYRLPITASYTLPLHATAIWNPVCDRAFFQVGAQLLSF